MHLLLMSVFTLLLMWLINCIRSPWMRAVASTLLFGSVLNASLTLGVMIATVAVKDEWPSFHPCFLFTGLIVYPMWFFSSLKKS